MKHFISIVVPCYNASAFFEPLFTCLKNQSCTDFELVLVNDGSTDNSEAEFERFSKDINFKTQWINQKNGGPGKARMTGMEIASGDYIFFLDADDILENDTVDFWYKSIKRTDFDILIAQSVTIASNKVISDKTHFVNISNNICIDFLYHNLPVTLWPSLYKKSVLKNLWGYEDYITGEDFVMLCQVYSIQNLNILISNQLIHRYICNEGSITSSMSERKYKDSYESFIKGMTYLEGKLDYKEEDIARAFVYKYLLFLYVSIMVGSPYCHTVMAKLKLQFGKNIIKNVLRIFPKKQKYILHISLISSFSLTILMRIIRGAKKLIKL